MPTLQHFTLTDQHGVRVATLDVPNRTMNVIDASVLGELRRVVDDALADASVRGVVLASGKSGAFGGGADLTTLPALADDSETPQFLQRTHDLMVMMADSPKPLVAAIHGYALGGALEVALGCGSIVVAEDAVLGFPESTLGLIPGGAGTQLVLSRVDPVAAIELLVSGRTLSANEAVTLGLVDRVVGRDDLLAVSVSVAASGTVPAHDHPSGGVELLEDVARAAAAVRRPPSGAARDALVAAVTAGLAGGRAAGLAAEREQFLALLGSEDCAALVHLFHVETAAKRRFRAAGGRPAAIAVVGAGQMGAGIAATAACHGISAAVRDIDETRIEEARDRVRAVGGPDAECRWTGTAGWDRFTDADVVVEAVFEEPGLKRETLALVEQQVGERTLITTNTSAIPVASLADVVSAPDRFLGAHFFSPVEKMTLVELVPHGGTSDAALTRAGGLARSLGKVPVVVADLPGFFTSRVYARWLIEGLRLLADGADPAAIEREAKAVGFPVGPLQASDEVTLELVLKASVVQVAERVLADRVDVAAVRRLLDRLICAGIRGKRFGRGFYAYDAGRRVGFDPDLAGLAGAGVGVKAGQAGERLLLAFVTESLLCWDDATLCHPDDGDLASVLGIGFPRRLGGPFHWVDRTGATEVLRRLDRLDAAAFPPGDALPRLSVEGSLFADEPRRDRPGQSQLSSARGSEGSIA